MVGYAYRSINLGFRNSPVSLGSMKQLYLHFKWPTKLMSARCHYLNSSFYCLLRSTFAQETARLACLALCCCNVMALLAFLLQWYRREMRCWEEIQMQIQTNAHTEKLVLRWECLLLLELTATLPLASQRTTVLKLMSIILECQKSFR